MLRHIKLLMKAITRILKMLLRGMQLGLLTLLVVELATCGMERILTQRRKRTPVGTSSHIGIFWLKTSLQRPRNLVSLRILYCILHDSLVFLGSSHIFYLGLQSGYLVSICNEDQKQSTSLGF